MSISKLTVVSLAFFYLFFYCDPVLCVGYCRKEETLSEKNYSINMRMRMSFIAVTVHTRRRIQEHADEDLNSNNSL